MGLVCVTCPLSQGLSASPAPDLLSCLLFSLSVTLALSSTLLTWSGSSVSLSPVPTSVPRLPVALPPTFCPSTSGVVTSQCHFCVSLTTCSIFHRLLGPASLLQPLPHTNSVSHPISNSQGSLLVHLLHLFSPHSVFLPHFGIGCPRPGGPSWSSWEQGHRGCRRLGEAAGLVRNAPV